MDAGESRTRAFGLKRAAGAGPHAYQMQASCWDSQHFDIFLPSSLGSDTLSFHAALQSQRVSSVVGALIFSPSACKSLSLIARWFVEHRTNKKFRQ